MDPLEKCLAAVSILAALPAAGAGALENPQPGATVSGIGVISGWHCTATRIELVFDSLPPVRAGSGTDRLDTQAACGRRDTGFGYLLNWAVLGAGAHTVHALADGVEFASAGVSVSTWGTEFLRGRTGSVVMDGFPDASQAVELAWSESQQSFQVQRVYGEAPMIAGRWNGADLERRSGCAQSQNDGNHGTYAQYDITASSDTLNISQAGVTGLTCQYRGQLATPFVIPGATGTYSCSDGKRGTWRVKTALSTATEMQLRMDIQLDTTETCAVDAILGGSRF
jgi:hypothetical protein